MSEETMDGDGFTDGVQQEVISDAPPVVLTVEEEVADNTARAGAIESARLLGAEVARKDGTVDNSSPLYLRTRYDTITVKIADMERDLELHKGTGSPTFLNAPEVHASYIKHLGILHKERDRIVKQLRPPLVDKPMLLAILLSLAAFILTIMVFQ